MAMLFGKKQVLVLGGAGVLGKAVVGAFKGSWKVTSVDFERNEEAQESVVLMRQGELQGWALACKEKLVGKYRAILSLAEEHAVGKISDIGTLHHFEEMSRANLQSSLLAAHLATKHLTDQGLLLFRGAKNPYIEATPSELAYGLTKTCTHWLALNLSVREQIPSVATVVTILPELIRTPTNIASNPGNIKWLEPHLVAALLKNWAEGKGKPENGSYIILKSEAGQVVPEFV